MPEPIDIQKYAHSWNRLDTELIQLALSFITSPMDMVCMQVGFRGDIEHIESYLHNMGYGPIKLPDPQRNIYKLINGYVVIESVNMAIQTPEGKVHGGEGLECPVVYIARVSGNPKWYEEEEEIWRNSVKNVAPLSLVDNIPTKEVAAGIVNVWMPKRRKSLMRLILNSLTRTKKNTEVDGTKLPDEEESNG